MNLAQRVFDVTPNWLRVRIFELTDEEKFFLEVLRDKKMKVREYIFSGESRSGYVECKYMMKTLNFLLDKYGKNGRFYRYFSEKAVSLGHYFKFLLKHY